MEVDDGDGAAAGRGAYGRRERERGAVVVEVCEDGVCRRVARVTMMAGGAHGFGRRGKEKQGKNNERRRERKEKKEILGVFF